MCYMTKLDYRNVDKGITLTPGKCIGAYCTWMRWNLTPWMDLTIESWVDNFVVLPSFLLKMLKITKRKKYKIIVRGWSNLFPESKIIIIMYSVQNWLKQVLQDLPSILGSSWFSHNIIIRVVLLDQNSSKLSGLRVTTPVLWSIQT